MQGVERVCSVKAHRLAVKGNGKPKSLLDIQGGPGRR